MLTGKYIALAIATLITCNTHALIKYAGDLTNTTGKEVEFVLRNNKVFTHPEFYRKKLAPHSQDHYNSGAAWLIQPEINGVKGAEQAGGHWVAYEKTDGNIDFHHYFK